MPHNFLSNFFKSKLVNDPEFMGRYIKVITPLESHDVQYASVETESGWQTVEIEPPIVVTEDMKYLTTYRQYEQQAEGEAG